MTDTITAVLRRNMFNAMDQGDYSQAALLLERLKEEDPLAVETRGIELEFLLRTRRLAEGRTLAEQLLQLFPGSPRVQYLAGQAAYSLKEYRPAADRFRESLRVSWHWRSALALAKALTQLGEYAEAATIFESLLPEHSECLVGLAWLYERQCQFERALASIEAYLKERPDSKWAKSQQLRLRARALDPEELIRETEGLLEFGEEIAEPIVPQYLDALFRTGHAAEARKYILEQRTQFNPQVTISAAWTCYRYQAYDLALELFISSFAANRGNVKFLAGIEFAASRCERLEDLVRLYEKHVHDDRRLYGRLRNLKRRIGGGAVKGQERT